MPDRRKSGLRFDFNVEVVETDDNTGRVTVRLTPDEDRYRWVRREDGKYLYDTLDDLYFPADLVHEAFAQFFSHKPLLQPALIDNAQDYWLARIPVIRESLRERRVPYDFVDKSEGFLDDLSADELNFVVLSVDVVGSTKLASELRASDYTILIRTALFEMSEVIPKFRGYVLKYTGDGLIAYFPEPTFITMHDLAIDCALTMRGTIHHAVNKVLPEYGLPRLELRIGMDSGQTAITVVGSTASKQHRDLIGVVVSLAVKIQSMGLPGEILYGETVERHLHTNWRRHSVPVDLPLSWKYSGPDEKPYRVYKCTLP
jgi:class 3 adenylate cyclase